MRIALINENSQVIKNNLIFNTLKKVADKYNHEVYNFGMINESDPNLTYVEAGLMAGILINSKTVDFCVMGCGTGSGAMLAANSFPNVFCGLIVDPTDAYLFSQINAGNAISIPFAKGFGWGAELTLENIFNELFKEESGKGYPKERSVPERNNREILKSVKEITNKDMLTILKEIDQNLLKETIDRTNFKENYNKLTKDSEIKKYIDTII